MHAEHAAEACSRLGIPTCSWASLGSNLQAS